VAAAKDRRAEIGPHVASVAKIVEDWRMTGEDADDDVDDAADGADDGLNESGWCW
jgi:hypothetical protein